MNETTLNGKSADILSENIQKLKQIFPEVFCEERIDFEKLQAVLGEYSDDDEERYNFTWWGKSRALRLAQTPSMGTLRPCKEESKDWDTTENLYIEGDNLEVLKLLQKSYHGRVKMIYIDPPYNTGNDFVYKDDYKDPLKNYLEMTGQVDESGKKIGTNRETSGRYHTNWLNMIYPRLRLARNLLRDDGVILINMDENEIANLHKLCDEIFGESNELGVVVWDKRNPKGDAKAIAQQHEYILVYAKNHQECLKENEIIRPKKNAEFILKKAKELFSNISTTFKLENVKKEFALWLNLQTGFSGGEQAYSKIDQKGRVYQSVSMAWPNKKKAPDDYFIPLIHPITNKPCPVPNRGWRNPSKTMKYLLENDLILFGKDENTQPRRKYLLEDNMYENLSSLLYFGGSDDALLNQMNIPFDTPKVVSICKEHILSFTDKDSIVFDFFSGSATTAHAVMALNAEVGGKRKFIMVQLPEPTDEKSEAYKAGYKNICEIGKERIRRAGEKIKAELREKQSKQPSMLEDKQTVNPDDLDIGFKVFKLDSSNLKKWNPDYENVESSLLDAIENFTAGRSELDVVYEIMLKYGIDLTFPIEEFEVCGKEIYSIGYGALMICLDNEITTDVANEIACLKEELKPEVIRVVFKDNGFKDDSVKTNTKEILRNAGIDEIVSI